MGPAILTLAIPTFRRRDTVVRSVELATEMLSGLPVSILVADNASEDGTVDALQGLRVDRIAGPDLEVVAGERNTGILGNFRRLARHCRTDFLLILSDEDDPAGREVIERLIARLVREAPDVLVADPQASGPSSRRSRDIDPRDFWSALNLLSGTVYRAESLRRSVEACDTIAQHAPIAGIWNLWPFYLSAVDIRIAGGRCCWHPEALRVQRERLETAIEDPLFRSDSAAPSSAPRGDALRLRYKSLEARLLQAEAMAQYLVMRSEDPSRPLDRRGRAVLRSFRAHHERQIFPTVAKRIRDDHPLLHRPFLRGAMSAVGLGARLRDPLSMLRGRGLRVRFRIRRGG